jgi:hypothetical protein
VAWEDPDGTMHRFIRCEFGDGRSPGKVLVKKWGSVRGLGAGDASSVIE